MSGGSIGSKGHPSSSAEQRAIEPIVRAALAQMLGVSFEAQPKSLGTLRLDAYAPEPPPMLVEIYAHVGPCKEGQQRKLSRDMTKLLLAERKLGQDCRKILALIDEEARWHLLRGWEQEFVQVFGIRTVIVPMPDEVRARLRAVQQRQRR